MSYFKKIEYEMIPEESFRVIRKCPGCGGKRHFINTNKFRVNANGSNLDVWLIYQCEECKHTLNLAIYERQKVVSIPKEEYQRFLDNDEQLAEWYGKTMQLFRKNKAEIDFAGLEYDMRKVHESAEYSEQDGKDLPSIVIVIKNPYRLRFRPEKQIAKVLGLPRSRVKRMLENGEISWENEM